MGLIGDDALHLKTSADGQTWIEAVRTDAASGRVDLSAGQLRVCNPATPVPLQLPSGTWSAQLVNNTNSDGQHEAAVGNVWYSASTWAFLVGTANGQVGGNFLPFFGVRGDGRSEFSGTVRLASVAKGALPSAADRGVGALTFVPDHAAGPVVAYSDGTTWRRIRDRSPVA